MKTSSSLQLNLEIFFNELNFKKRCQNEMKKKEKKGLSLKGKVTPFFFSMLFAILCAVSIFMIHPVLYFLKYFAAFGLIIAVLLLAYILKTDEI